MSILVIDVGTSSIRGILFDNDGKDIFEHQVNYKVRFFNEIFAEQNARDWLDAIIDICKNTVHYCTENQTSLDAISLTSQRSSIIPVDKDGKALRPAIMWQDTRNESIVTEKKKEEAFVQKLTGARINTVFSGTKMTWFRRNEPELYEQTYKICTIADLIVHEMTDQFSTDLTYGARSLLINIHTGQWDDQLLDYFEVEKEKLCTLVPQGSIIGTISKRFADKTGISQGIPLISAGGDQQCAALGQGIIEPGSVEITVGTGAFLLGYCEQIPNDLSGDMICGVHAIPDKYVLEGSILTCAALYNWAKKEFFSNASSFEQMNAEVESSPAGANGCLALPYFQGRGTPDWNSSAKGAFLNMNLGTTRGDMIRALLEGIALEISNNLDIMERYAGIFDRAYIGGGLTNFHAFNQILSDSSQHMLLKEKSMSEQTAFGAWMSAAVTLKLVPDYASAFAKKRTHDYEQIQPDPKYQDLYKKKKDEMNLAYSQLFGKKTA